LTQISREQQCKDTDVPAIAGQGHLQAFSQVALQDSTQMESFSSIAADEVIVRANQSCRTQVQQAFYSFFVLYSSFFCYMNSEQSLD
jgi:hypothetical protein